jgi:hypothetical protein
MPLTAEARDRLRLGVAAIGLAIVLLAVMWASFSLIPKKYLDFVFSTSKWGRFAGVTVVFVGYCLKTYWRARKYLGFWIILLGILAIHFLVVGYFYYAGAGLPLLIFGPVVALEWALLAFAAYSFLGIGPPVGKR